MRPWLAAFLDRLLDTGAGELLAPNYVVMLSVAMVLGGALALRTGFARGFEMRRGLLALALGYPGALVGARLLTVVTKIPGAVRAADPSLLWTGGLAAYGGFLGGMLAVWLGLGRRDFLAFGDVCAATLGLGTFVTRLGCFLAGCDYGAVTAVPWAVRFPAGSPAFQAHLAAGWVGPLSAGSLPVHPTELYESALGLAIAAAALVWLRRRRGRPLDGRVFLGAVAAYAAGRFLVESFRGDVDRGLWLGTFSTSQLVSLAVLALVAGVALRRFARPVAAVRVTAGSTPGAVAIAALALGSVLVLTARAAVAAPPAVAVVDRGAAGAPGAGVRTALVDLVAGTIGTGRVLAPVTVRAILAEKGIAPEKVVDPVSWAAVARLLEVDLVVAVTATLDDEGAGFASTVYDKKGKTRWSLNEPCPRCTPAQLEEAARHLASRLSDAVLGKTPAAPAGLEGAKRGPDPGAHAPGAHAAPPRDPFGGDAPAAPETSPGDPTGGGGPETSPAAPVLVPDGAALAAAAAFPDAHPLAVRVGLGPAFVIGRRTVPTLGYQFLVEGSYTVKNRTELGGQFLYFINADAKHFTFAATFEWKLGRALKGALYAGGSAGLTHVVFDTAAKSVTAFDTRARFGWEALFGRWFGLRLELLNLSILLSEAFGLIPAWEPRIMASWRH